MTPRTIWIMFGASVLVAGAFFSLARKTPRERSSVAPADVRADEAQEREPAAPPDALRPARQTQFARPSKPESSAGNEREYEASFAEEIEEEFKKPSVRELHLPVIRAIRENHPRPEVRKEAMLKALRASGNAEDAWAERGAEIFDKWGKLMPQGVEHATLRNSLACYQAGCEIVVRFPNQEEAEKAAEAFRQLDDTNSDLHAGRVQTPAVAVGAGAYEANWIMLRPEGS